MESLVNEGEITSTTIHELAAAGFDGFITKPLTIKKFRELKFGLNGMLGDT
jgi:hypothetical protein